MFAILTILFALVSVALVLIILVQRPQGGGLAGAFGGAGGGGTDTVFGGRTGDALTWATVIGFAIWLIIAILLNTTDFSNSPSAPPAVEGTTDSSTDTGATDTTGAADDAVPEGSFNDAMDDLSGGETGGV